jgi:hypothetical protein
MGWVQSFFLCLCCFVGFHHQHGDLLDTHFVEISPLPLTYHVHESSASLGGAPVEREQGVVHQETLPPAWGSRA